MVVNLGFGPFSLILPPFPTVTSIDYGTIFEGVQQAECVSHFVDTEAPAVRATAQA